MKLATVIAALLLAAYGQSAELQCGKTPIEPDLTGSRIVGGKVVKEYSWPWQVALCVGSSIDSCRFYCGGSVIGNEWILTAGHCVRAYVDRPEVYHIKIGVFKYESLNENSQVNRDVSEVHLHPLHKPSTTSYDCGLLKLKQPINYTNEIQPICMAEQDSGIVSPPGSCYVTGWGNTRLQLGGRTSQELKQVHVPFVDHAKCDDEFGGRIDDSMICAGKKGQGSCFGDSGGPLVVKDEVSQSWKQYGIVSFGPRNCANGVQDGVYGRVTQFCDFVKNVTGIDCV